jgi:hypothetical protein
MEFSFYCLQPASKQAGRQDVDLIDKDCSAMLSYARLCYAGLHALLTDRHGAADVGVLRH